MTIKKYLLIIIFFIIGFIILKNMKKNNENFTGNYFSQKYGAYNFLIDSPEILNPYNSENIDVQLSNIVLNPLNLKYFHDSQFQLLIKNKLINLFPLKNKPYKDIYQILKSSNEDKNILSYVNEDI